MEKQNRKATSKGDFSLSVSQGLFILFLLTHRWFNHPVREPGSPQYLALQERRQLQCGLQPGWQQGPASPRHRNHTEDPPPRRPPHLQGSRKESHIEKGAKLTRQVLESGSKLSRGGSRAQVLGWLWGSAVGGIIGGALRRQGSGFVDVVIWERGSAMSVALLSGFNLWYESCSSSSSTKNTTHADILHILTSSHTDQHTQVGYNDSYQ